jgi:hypothetical protein
MKTALSTKKQHSQSKQYQGCHLGGFPAGIEFLYNDRQSE